METHKLYFKMLENGIEELRTEKYQQEKNGIAKALMATLKYLQNEVKNLTIPDVSGSFKLTFEQCLNEEFLINTQNYPKEYHHLFNEKFNRAKKRFEQQ